MSQAPQTPAAAPAASVNTQAPQTAADTSAQAKLPHERDQSINMTDAQPCAHMQQAHQDLQRGLVDTDARGADGKPLGDDVPTA